MTELVYLFKSLAFSDKYELTLEITCVSSEDPTPMTFAPLERSCNSSCSPVYMGLGRALASEVVTDVIMNKEWLRQFGEQGLVLRFWWNAFNKRTVLRVAVAPLKDIHSLDYM